MKLSKTAWWILGIGFFVITAGVLLMIHSGQAGDEKQIEESLSVTQTLLANLTADKEELTGQLTLLENQLDEAETSFTNAEAEFPEVVPSIDYDEELFLIAHDCDLEVLGLTASEPDDKEVEDTITFTITNFEVEVRGDVADILAFIDNVATGDYFTTTTVALVDLEVPDPDEDETPTATIQIVIYSYEGE
jgi:hypothetical protein